MTVSKTFKTPTGFFDLPLELRQMVYEELLLSQKTIRFLGAKGTIDLGSKSVVLAGKADKRLKDEIVSLLHKRTRRLEFIISDSPLRLPSEFKFENVEHVKVTIEHYKTDCSSGSDGKCERFTEEALKPLRDNLFKLGKWLNKSPTKIPRLDVWFRDDSSTANCGYDTHWHTLRKNNLNVHGGSWKDVTLCDGRRMPVAQYALEFLWDFPIFDAAWIFLPEVKIDMFDDFGFDEGYMNAVAWNLMVRLRGGKGGPDCVAEKSRLEAWRREIQDELEVLESGC